jgi:hypothetical protein
VCGQAILDGEKSFDGLEISQTYFDVSDSLNFEYLLVHPELFSQSEDIKASNDVSNTYWIRYMYHRDRSCSSAPHAMEIYSSYVDETEIWFVDAKTNEVLDHQSHNAYDSFDSRSKYKSVNIIHELPVSENGVVCLVRIKHSSVDLYEFYLKPFHELMNYSTTEYLLLGLYYGLLLFFFTYNLTFYLQTKDPLVLYYLGFILSAGLLSLSEDGLGFQFLWNNSASWNHILSYVIAPTGLNVALSLYFYRFFQLNTIGVGRWVLGSTVAVNLLAWGLYLLDLNSFNHYGYLAHYSFLYVLALVVLSNRTMKSILFMIAFTAVIFSLVISNLFYLGFLDSGIFTVYAFDFCMVLEAMAFGVAMNVKFKEISDDRETVANSLIGEQMRNLQLKDKVNKELEDRVQQRTKELHSANEKYEALNTKLMKMNEQMDLQNWRMAKEHKETTQNLLKGELVGFKTFEEHVGDNVSCLTLLENHKWGATYECRKCGNSKFGLLKNKRSRKCTRCNTIESPLKGTLLEGVRFPLVKAFYLVYVVSYNQKVSITELADNLGVSQITVKKFIIKSEKSLQTYKEQQGRRPKSWEELLII